MFFRMNLLMEEVGEICQCLTKGKDAIAEEHADLLIVLLGNCFALGIDIESEFWRKIDKISRYGTRLTGNHCRLVSPSEHGSATGIK
jgi:NTP pyrophosphatase (non-canonical NTP hydrolase)